MTYCYVVPTDLPKDKFKVSAAKDGASLYEGSMNGCDFVAGLLNAAYEEGFTTGKANAERPRKTTVQKLFPQE
jgi:hypothetical protein